MRMLANLALAFGAHACHSRCDGAASVLGGGTYPKCCLVPAGEASAFDVETWHSSRAFQSGAQSLHAQARLQHSQRLPIALRPLHVHCTCPRRGGAQVKHATKIETPPDTRRQTTDGAVTRARSLQARTSSQSASPTSEALSRHFSQSPSLPVSSHPRATCPHGTRLPSAPLKRLFRLKLRCRDASPVLVPSAACLSLLRSVSLPSPRLPGHYCCFGTVAAT